MRKGVSPIIATVLLIAITVSIAFLIFSFGNKFITQLSPAPDCSEVIYKAGIYETIKGYILEIDNAGNIDIEGFNFIISDESKGEKNLEKINIKVKAGQSISQLIDIKNNIKNRELSIVPITNNIKGEAMACDFRTAKKINLINEIEIPLV